MYGLPGRSPADEGTTTSPNKPLHQRPIARILAVCLTFMMLVATALLVPPAPATAAGPPSAPTPANPNSKGPAPRTETDSVPEPTSAQIARLVRAQAPSGLLADLLPQHGQPSATALRAAAKPAMAGKTTGVSGRLTYSISNGQRHSSRANDLFLIDVLPVPQILGHVTKTTSTGEFFFPLVSTTRKYGPFDVPRVLLVVAASSGPGYTVQPAIKGGPYLVGSILAQAKPGEMRMNVDTPKGTTRAETLTNSAFAIADALTTGVEYARKVDPDRAIAPITTVWPGSRTYSHYKRANATAPPTLNIADDAFNFDWFVLWDVVLHEYGHFASDQWNFFGETIDISGVGGHRLNSRMATALQDRAAGAGVGWQEGFADYFSVAAQVEMDVADKAIPGAGDVKIGYVDIDKPTGFGEDNELAVATILWQFGDNASSFGIGHTTLIQTLMQPPPTPNTELAYFLPPLMRAAGGVSFDKFSAATDIDKLTTSNAVACAMGKTEVAPTISEPSSTDEPPILLWSRGGAPGNDGRGNFTLSDYELEVWRQDWSKKITTLTPTPESTSDNRYRYSISSDEWQTVLDEFASDEDVSVTFVMRGTYSIDGDTTGPYQGCGIKYGAPSPTITVSPAPGTTLIQPKPNLLRCQNWDVGSGTFSLDGTSLKPNTRYQLMLHDMSETVADVSLGSINADPQGSLTKRIVQLPAMPAGISWILSAAPAQGPSASSPIEITPGMCIYHLHTDTQVQVDITGMGAAPGATVSANVQGTPVTVTADQNGNFGPSTVVRFPCGPTTFTVSDAEVPMLGPAVQPFTPFTSAAYCAGAGLRKAEAVPPPTS